MDNYYCNGLWFNSYQVARNYANEIQEWTGKYVVVFTKAEKDSILNAIVHEIECGK